MQEVRVEHPITVTAVEGGHQIAIHPGRPPITPLIFAGGFGSFLLFVSIVAPEIRGMGFMSLILFGVCAWHIHRHKKTQIVSIINNKLVVDNKQYDISNISRIEFGNSITKTTSASFTPTSTTFIAASPSVGAAVGVGMANAVTGIVNAGQASNAKKAFYVAIFFGAKKITIAKNMREPTGLAFYDELGRRLSMK